MATSRKGQGIIDITGKRFGRLVVVEQDIDGQRNRHARWWCRCDCGMAHSVDGVSLRKGGVRSCGCYRSDVSKAACTTHGYSKSRIHVAWCAMRSRCHNESHKDYPQYGGRGISICAEWDASFESFLSDMGEPDLGMTLERNDVNGGYCKSNCYWATRRTQARNTRRAIRIDGRLLIEICEEIGIRHKTVMARIRAGVPVDRALDTTPTQYRRENERKSA